jgi:hypothetical protein
VCHYTKTLVEEIIEAGLRQCLARKNIKVVLEQYDSGLD